MGPKLLAAVQIDDVDSLVRITEREQAATRSADQYIGFPSVRGPVDGSFGRIDRAQRTIGVKMEQEVGSGCQ